LAGILTLNLLSYAVSISALLVVDVPLTPHTLEGERARSGFLKEAMYGIRYILSRPGLLGLQLIFFFGNFFSGVALSVTSLFTMVSLRTGGDPSSAGTAQSAAAIAALAAGIFLTALGGIRRPVRAIVLGWVLSSLFGLTLLGAGKLLLFWVIAAVVDALFEPVVNVSLDTFLQTKIPPDVQGRVFSASDFLAQAMIPLTPLVAGFLGEGIFEPREVVLGARSEDFYEIKSGVAEGEFVVTSGNFLIDSESRLKAALQGIEGKGGEAHQHGQ
jgi:hypothetical protein